MLPGPPALAALTAPYVAAGDVIGSYRVVRVIRQGATATVVEALREDIGKRAALKVLHPLLSQEGEALARFQNEARAVNLIGHPGLVSVFEFGRTAGGAAYLAMDLLPGETLAQRLAQRARWPVPLVLRWCQQLVAALLPVHALGIVHRDLKPSNIMLIPARESRRGSAVVDPEEPVGTERCMILDFGIAKLAPGLGAVAELDQEPLTQTGALLGTPAYMAPEQCRGLSAVTTQADVYALGVLCYQLLAGQLPFSAALAFDLLNAHVYRSPPPLRALAPELPLALTRLVHAMLSKEPARRPTLPEVAAALAALAQTNPPPPPAPERRAPRWPLPAALCAVLCGALALRAGRPTDARPPSQTARAAPPARPAPPPPAAPPRADAAPEGMPAQAPRGVAVVGAPPHADAAPEKRPREAQRPLSQRAVPVGRPRARPAPSPGPVTTTPRNEEISLFE